MLIGFGVCDGSTVYLFLYPFSAFLGTIVLFLLQTIARPGGNRHQAWRQQASGLLYHKDIIVPFYL
jgi:hypothetical protein